MKAKTNVSDTRYLQNDFVCINSLEGITDEGINYTFRLPRVHNLRYIYVNEVFCCLSISIQKKELDAETGGVTWTGITANDKIAPTGNWLICATLYHISKLFF